MKLASIEIFKIKKGFAPPIMESILKGRNNTYVRNFQEFETKKKNCIFWFRNNKLQISTIMVSPARTHEAT